MPNTAAADASPTGQDRSVFIGVFLVSMSVLLLQISLTRIFSFTMWYHFAYVTISVALLGYGASGSLLAVFPGLSGPSLARRLPVLAFAASVSILITLIICAKVPFHPFQVRLNPAQQIPLMILFYGGVTAPFFLAGLCISIALKALSHKVGRLYFFDLLGAGIGCFLVVFAINALTTPGSVILSAALVGLAGVSFSSPGSRARMGMFMAGVAAVALAGTYASRNLEFHPSPEKFFAKFLGQPSIKTYKHRWSAIFRTDVWAWSNEEESRGGSYAGWGISEKWEADPNNKGPKLRGIAHDGDACAVIYNFDGDLSKLDMFDHHVLKLPYLLLDKPEVLVIGVGGGTDIVNAIKNHAKHVTGIELDPITVDIVKYDQADFAGHIYDRPDVTMIAGEGRSTLRHSNKSYDLIQLTAVDTLAALSTGAYVLAENYLYTVEAMEEFLAHLNPDGVLSVLVADFDERSMGFPRHTIRQMSLYIEALRRMGVDNPEDHIAIVAGGLGTPNVEMLVKKKPMTPAEVEKIRLFAEEMGFGIWALPGSSIDRLHSRYLRAKGEARARVLAPYPLTLHATTDNNPFFFNFYKWRYLHKNLEVDVGHTLATGQIVMALILAMSIVTSLALILGPLMVFHRKGLKTPGQAGFILFFLGIGLGFIFIEISFVQKFVLFLGYPTYSLTVVLFSLLTYSGIGSFLTSKMKTPPKERLAPVMLGLTILSLLYVVILPLIFDALLGEAFALRVIVSSLLLLPLGLLMGMLFPSGIQIVRDANPDFVPWAWAINGCGSVVGTVLSVSLAMSFGFRFVTYAAITLYIIGVLGMRAAAKKVAAA